MKGRPLWYTALLENEGGLEMKWKLKYNAPVTLTFALICAGTLALNALTGGASNALLFVAHRGPLLSPLTWLRLFTHVLGHVSWEHYVGNMMLFLLLGPMLEEKYGSGDLALVIAVTALVTGCVHCIISPAGLLGASGVVFAFIILASMTSFQAGEVPLTLVLVVILYLGREVATGLFTQDNVSQLAHIVGGLSGALCGYLAAAGSKKTIS